MSEFADCCLHDSAFDPKNGDIEVVQPPCGGHIDTVEAYAAQTTSAEENLEALKNRFKPNSIDWAMFKISGERSVFNMIHGVDHEKGLGSWSSLSTARVKFQGTAGPVEDGSVVKISRNTDVTFGIISGVKDGVNLKENRGGTIEWCVVGKNGADFSAAGGSGSLVFNERFQVVGLLTAGCDSVGRITYMTPINIGLQNTLVNTMRDLKF
ncbi:hypothetical protein TWF970_001187 [Orbilia oligospora]|uniref:Peptidase S1 domain-containing protein n=1 Tax=Orbilia oligospora TaxID=2813651 RepID=A0A7C8RBL2_ORBOL|nr:hypothetical protein TWF970_001187 [Orbilia oligospora]